ncbi:nucleotidyltransferase domain-containing protein [Nostoc sp. XA010]|uniref:nucleotidyltransferase domain-containing protein n=1 Tax=Nostoc sp. XA010 TaxID=2780407 RepID=UPI001E6371F5|nr:nucleotidyltransferase domain-containing protein [Nostoc sp. XA010]MCC5660217.1 nucleotidyltransferase domain-containing protein [Nostoc sp. XA010]
MTDKTQYLLKLVKRNVKAYITNAKTKAVMVTGSVAEGLCDEYSDCDVMLYYDELPSEEELHLARQQNQGSLIGILGDRQQGAIGESFLVNGVECQFAHATIAQWEKEISTILEEFDVQSPIMKAMSGTLVGIPLYGETLIGQWKAKIANYPDGLAQTMVEHYLKFVPIWGMQPKLAKRDTTLWYYQILVESAQNLLGVLSGLNHLYYSTFQFKRMSRFIQKMEIAPENLVSRLEGLFCHQAPVAVNELEALLRETVELVEVNMQRVDTSEARRRLGWRQQPWKLREPDR